jgi:hypothetical protein
MRGAPPSVHILGALFVLMMLVGVPLAAGLGHPRDSISVLDGFVLVYGSYAGAGMFVALLWAIDRRWERNRSGN